MKLVVSSELEIMLLMASQNFAAYSESPLNAVILQLFTKTRFYC